MSQFPSSIYSVTNPAGSDQVSVVDHAAQHSGANGEIIAIETTLGTTGGTSVLKNFTAGQFALKNQTDTFTNGTLVTPTIQGGTVTGQFSGIAGTLNGITLGTPSIGTIGVAGTVAPLSIGAGLAPTVVPVSDPGSAGTAVINAQAGQIFSMVLGTVAGTRTLGTPTNPTDGQFIIYRIKQNVNSSGTIAFSGLGTTYKFSGGTANASSLGTTASTWNYIGFRYNSVGTSWDDAGNSTSI